MIAHPFLIPDQNIKNALANVKKRKLHKIMISQSALSGMGDLLEDINPFDDIGNMVEGLASAMTTAIDGIIQTIGTVIQTIIDIVTGILNLIAWDKIFENLLVVVRELSAIQVQLNPERLLYNFLATNDLTRHSFMELDKFTGGMITSAVNVSTLVHRSIAGEPITKEELIRDAIFALQVGAVVVGGPAAAGGMVGNMVGKELCKNAGEAKEVCQIAVTIAAAATANYAADYYGVSWGLPSGTEQLADSSGQTVSSGATDTLVQSQNNFNAIFAQEGVSLNFSDYLSQAAVQVLEQRGVQEVTKQAVKLCQQGNWVGDRECAILGQIAANYINSPEGMDWPTFLAQEAARLGVSLLMEQWFPKDSPEAAAIHYQINYSTVEVPGQTIIYQTKPKSNAKFLALLAAGGAATLMLIS